MSKTTTFFNFIRHFVEMVIAMFAGMVALGIASAAVLPVLGTTGAQLERDVPALTLLAMGVAMTVPMVWWMRYRGHSWQPCVEMSAAMLIPTFVTIGLLATGLVTDYMELMAFEHTVMFPAMLVAMLLRRSEYTGSHHQHHSAEAHLTPLSSPAVAENEGVAV